MPDTTTKVVHTPCTVDDISFTNRSLLDLIKFRHPSDGIEYDSLSAPIVDLSGKRTGTAVLCRDHKGKAVVTGGIENPVFVGDFNKPGDFIQLSQKKWVGLRRGWGRPGERTLFEVFYDFETAIRSHIAYEGTVTLAMATDVDDFFMPLGIPKDSRVILYSSSWTTPSTKEVATKVDQLCTRLREQGYSCGVIHQTWPSFRIGRSITAIRPLGELKQSNNRFEEM